LPVELLAHFPVHIDVTAQEIRVEIISASVAQTPYLSMEELFR